MVVVVVVVVVVAVVMRRCSGYAGQCRCRRMAWQRRGR